MKWVRDWNGAGVRGRYTIERCHQSWCVLKDGQRLAYANNRKHVDAIIAEHERLEAIAVLDRLAQRD